MTAVQTSAQVLACGALRLHRIAQRRTAVGLGGLRELFYGLRSGRAGGREIAVRRI